MLKLALDRTSSKYRQLGLIREQGKGAEANSLDRDEEGEFYTDEKKFRWRIPNSKRGKEIIDLMPQVIKDYGITSRLHR